MNTECDNGISPQIRNDAYSFYFLTDQHNHKDSGKCGNVYLEYVAGIIVGPHTRRGGGEVHYDQCQQDKLGNNLVEPMTGEQEEIISANPETCHIEGEGSHGNVYIQRKFDVKFAQEESCASDQ